MTNKTIVFLAVGGFALGLAIAVKAAVKGKKEKIDDNANNEEDDFESHVCDHDGNGLSPLDPSMLWHVTAKFKGNGPPWRRMIVYRPTGTKSLILLSPTAVNDDIMSEIDKLGTVEILLVPNSYHRTDVGVFKKRYPNAKVACPPGWVRKGVAEVVQVDMDARELGSKYNDSIKVVRIGGLCDQKESEGDFEYAYEFHLSDGKWAYAVTDTLFNFADHGFMNWVFGCRGIDHPDGSTTPKVGRISKFFMHSRTECAKFYRELSKRNDISMILLAHGDVLLKGVKEAFAAIADDVDPM